jgi:RNA polymerase sigma-70 factor, ECF subfamily
MVFSMTPDTERLWAQLHANIRSFVGRRLGNAADVDDVVQRVFLQLHRALPTLRDHDRVPGWIYRTARNAIADHYRAPAHRREVSAGDIHDLAETAPAENDTASAADESSAVHELAGCMRPLLEALPLVDQETLGLVEFQGVAQSEAARRLGLSVSGMKSRVQRARHRLKALLEDCCRVELDRRSRIVSYEARRPDSCNRC